MTRVNGISRHTEMDAPEETELGRRWSPRIDRLPALLDVSSNDRRCANGSVKGRVNHATKVIDNQPTERSIENGTEIACIITLKIYKYKDPA